MVLFLPEQLFGGDWGNENGFGFGKLKMILRFGQMELNGGFDTIEWIKLKMKIGNMIWIIW